MVLALFFFLKKFIYLFIFDNIGMFKSLKVCKISRERAPLLSPLCSACTWNACAPRSFLRCFLHDSFFTYWRKKKKKKNGKKDI